jgi:DNA-binding transcriptional ArsR family regulator
VRLHLFRVLADGGEHGSAPSDFRLERLHKSTMSHHFRVLRQAGLTSTRTSGRNRYIRLRRDDLDARFPGLVGALLRSLPEG